MRIPAAPPPGTTVEFFAWAPDASRIAYVADQEADLVFELFTSLAAGGGNVKVSGPMVVGGSVSGSPLGNDPYAPPRFAWAPDSSRLAYLANQARERNCGRLEWSVLNWNEPAINFYKGLGAVPMDEWTVFRVTGDALIELAGEN